MINIKKGVVWHHMTWYRWQMWDIIHAAVTAANFVTHGYVPTVTSGVEGRHSVNSKHYTGWALDFRIRDLGQPELDNWVKKMKTILGPKYLVLLEATHVHIQYRGEEVNHD